MREGKQNPSEKRISEIDPTRVSISPLSRWGLKKKNPSVRNTEAFYSTCDPISE